VCGLSKHLRPHPRPPCALRDFEKAGPAANKGRILNVYQIVSLEAPLETLPIVYVSIPGQIPKELKWILLMGSTAHHIIDSSKWPLETTFCSFTTKSDSDLGTLLVYFAHHRYLLRLLFDVILIDAHYVQSETSVCALLVVYSRMRPTYLHQPT
jgi:hypothetical protein